MDRENVIIPTDNLDELEQDMIQWTTLPYNVRQNSDDACIRRYGMTNIDLFNKIKAMIMRFNYSPDNINNQEDDNLVTESTFENFFHSDIVTRTQLSLGLQKNPLIVIIDPTDNDDVIFKKMNSFGLLTDTNKRFSNDYSMQLWGYNVPNMYDILINKRKSQEIDINTNDNLVRESVIKRTDDLFSPLEDQINHLIVEDNKLELFGYYKNLEESKDEYNSYGSSKVKILSEAVENAINCESYKGVLPLATPFFTEDELEELLGTEKFDHIVFPKDNDYFKALKEAKSDEELLSLGWNPSVSINENTMKYAQERQERWFQEHGARIIDYTSIIKEENLQYLTQINTHDDLSAYPFYIVYQYPNGSMTPDNIGFASESSLRVIYNFKDKSTKSIDYLQKMKYTITVYAIMVSKETFMNLVQILLGFSIGQNSDIVMKMTPVLDYIISQLRNKNYGEADSIIITQCVILLQRAIHKYLKLEGTVDLLSNPKVYRIYKGNPNGEEVKNTIDNFITLIYNYQDTSLSDKYFSTHESVITSAIYDKIMDDITPTVYTLV